MTETASSLGGTLYYDGTCSFCVNGVTRMSPLLSRIRVEVAPFEHGADEPEMKLRWHDGRLVGGGDVLFFLARRVWWAAPLGWLEWVPGCRRLVRWLYRKVADRRHCIGAEGACRI